MLPMLNRIKRFFRDGFKKKDEPEEKPRGQQQPQGRSGGKSAHQKSSQQGQSSRGGKSQQGQGGRSADRQQGQGGRSSDRGGRGQGGRQDRQGSQGGRQQERHGSSGQGGRQQDRHGHGGRQSEQPGFIEGGRAQERQAPQGQSRGKGPSQGQGRRPQGQGAPQGGRSPERQGPPPSSPRAGGASKEIFMEGIIQVKGRFGFLLSEDPALPDAFIGPDTLRLAMGGDRVLARVRTGRDGIKSEGEIIKVLKRARSTMVGTYQKASEGDVVRPEADTAPIKITDRGGFNPEEGEAVVVRITNWPTLDQAGEGVLTEVLGRPDDSLVQMRMLIRKYELAETFPAEVVKEAEAYGTQVPEAALAGRETFFHLPVMTIDGADAKDFDDAVSLEPLPNGEWRLGVHIADVSHYVTEGSALDEEAFARATSVYMPGQVVPMLPPTLSDDLCSLRPERLRLTLSCILDIGADGRVLKARTANSAIKSARRFTYEEVEEILRGRDVANVAPEVRRDVEAMGKLARLLRERRVKRGALDLDFPEAKIVLDERGRAVDVVKKARLESHRLIEEFMLLANEGVAELMKDRPFLYRIHEKPSTEKLEKLAKTLRAYDVDVPAGFESGQSHALQKVLKSVEGRPITPVIHMMCLRSLMKAVYSPLNAGHYGLASPFYTHFTSPIRRYPDLCVHRIIKESIAQTSTRERQAHWKLALPEICGRSSARERMATEMERESMQLNRVQIMKARVGETFEAIITGISPFGFFVQPDEVFVEGLVPVAGLQDDYYVYDEVRATLRGRRTGKTFAMGDKVKVQLAAANDVKRQLDFELADAPKGQGSSSSRSRGPEPRREGGQGRSQSQSRDRGPSQGHGPSSQGQGQRPGQGGGGRRRRRR